MCQYSSVDGFANDWQLVHLGSRAVGGQGASDGGGYCGGSYRAHFAGRYGDLEGPADRILARIAAFIRKQARWRRFKSPTRGERRAAMFRG